MTELSKLFPVVFATVQLAVLLIVPVSQVVTAHRAPTSTKKKSLGNVCREQRKRTEKEEEMRGFFSRKTNHLQGNMAETQRHFVKSVDNSKACG